MERKFQSYFSIYRDKVTVHISLRQQRNEKNFYCEAPWFFTFLSFLNERHSIHAIPSDLPPPPIHHLGVLWVRWHTSGQSAMPEGSWCLGSVKDLRENFSFWLIPNHKIGELTHVVLPYPNFPYLGSLICVLYIMQSKQKGAFYGQLEHFIYLATSSPHFLLTWFCSLNSWKGKQMFKWYNFDPGWISTKSGTNGTIRIC